MQILRDNDIGSLYYITTTVCLSLTFAMLIHLQPEYSSLEWLLCVCEFAFIYIYAKQISNKPERQLQTNICIEFIFTQINFIN